MSTADGDGEPDGMNRYRAGLPPRSEEERETYAEWARLDADDFQSAYEERLGPDQAWEAYDGPLSWSEFKEDYTRVTELEQLGIPREALPPPYASALGPDRAERLGWQVDDALIGLAYSPQTREQAEMQAQRLGVARRALNVPLCEQVVGLEDRWDELNERLSDVRHDAMDMEDGLDSLEEGPGREQLSVELAARKAEVDGLREELQEVREELTALAGHEDHPDRWVERHGQEFADALASRQQVEQERAATAVVHDQQSELEAAQARQADFDASQETLRGVEEHERLAIDRGGEGPGMDFD